MFFVFYNDNNVCAIFYSRFFMNVPISFLAHKAYMLRYYSLVMPAQAGSGHTTSCLSAADIVSVLFFYAMRFEPQEPDNTCNDRFILSKGHASALLYAAWRQVGVITEDQLMTYRQCGSPLEGHPTHRFVYAEAATGSLGMGLSIGLGQAFAARIGSLPYKTYVLLGDGEMSEGSVWEAVEVAAFYKMDQLIGIIDVNRLGQSDSTMVEHDIGYYEAILQAFGWHTIITDGHDIPALMMAFDQARSYKGKPTMIIAKTLKGAGVDFLQDKQGFHGKALSKDEAARAISALHKRYEDDVSDKSNFVWQSRANLCNLSDQQITASTTPQKMSYEKRDSIATRHAYGQALSYFGYQYDKIVSLDGDVKNSTYAEVFEQSHPERFIQCFIAEQNMVSMGVGLAKRGYIPFISTFACFFSRAYDQIRMAALSNAPLRLVGSHAGVSIGQDGPSQMGLEDIAIMNAIPGSVIVYPSDAVATRALVSVMVQHYDGISYLRTTRGATPVLYDQDEKFVIGGCKVLRESEHDVCCIVAAGITVFEALKAYDMLMQDTICIGIIDLYSVKPFDKATVLDRAQKSNNTLIVVEDHYVRGGIGQIVCAELANSSIYIHMLGVTDMPCSGRPGQLLAWAGIDARSIVKVVKKIYP
jgi:transketolase